MRSFLAPIPERPIEPADSAPTFSVATAAYQVADVVSDALDSIRQQTTQRQEVIVCDDGSTDALEDALAPYREQIVFVRKTHGGEASAKNAAAARARRQSGAPARDRLQALAMAASPELSRRMLRRRAERLWVGAGGIRVAKDPDRGLPARLARLARLRRA